jgi:hypothetical protein
MRDTYSAGVLYACKGAGVLYACRGAGVLYALSCTLSIPQSVSQLLKYSLVISQESACVILSLFLSLFLVLSDSLHQ